MPRIFGLREQGEAADDVEPALARARRRTESGPLKCRRRTDNVTVRGQVLAVIGRYAEAADLGARDALLHELLEPLPAAERAELLLAVASLPGDVDDGIIVALVGELDCSDAVVRMAAASALERVFARVPSEAEIAPEPEAPVEPAPPDASPDAPPAEALAGDAPPADEPPPEPKRKKKKG